MAQHHRTRPGTHVPHELFGLYVMNLFTYALILISTLCTLSAQLLLKHVVGTPTAKAAMASDPTQFLLHTMSSPLTWFAFAIQVAGYVVWLFVLSREKMGIALALSGSCFYLLAVTASWIFFSEKLSTAQLSGIILITVGIFLMASAK